MSTAHAKAHRSTGSGGIVNRWAGRGRPASGDDGRRLCRSGRFGCVLVGWDRRADPAMRLWRWAVRIMCADGRGLGAGPERDLRRLIQGGHDGLGVPVPWPGCQARAIDQPGDGGRASALTGGMPRLDDNVCVIERQAVSEKPARRTAAILRVVLAVRESRIPKTGFGQDY